MSTSTLTAEDIAAELRKMAPTQLAWNQTMLSFCAEKFERVTVPPKASDGMTDRDALLAEREEGAEALSKVIPDLRREIETISVSGNVITLAHVMTGTAPDGKTFRVGGTYIFTVENGQIVKLGMEVDPEVEAYIRNLVPAISELEEQYRDRVELKGS